MELRNIKSFLRAAELQNFTHAADDLGYSQATITMQIKQLEEELGTPLFERFGRNVKLTQHGEIFARRAAVILSEVDSAVAELNDDEIKGDLTIASADSVCMHILPGILMEFRKKCPKVHVSIKTGIDVALHEMIQKNEIDLMFMLGEMEHRSEWIHVVDKEEQKKNPEDNGIDIEPQPAEDTDTGIYFDDSNAPDSEADDEYIELDGF